MDKSKRIISLLLCFVLVFGMIPITPALAASPNITTEAAYDVGCCEATVSAYVATNGGNFFKEHGFYYGTTTSCKTKVVVDDNGGSGTSINTPARYTYTFDDLDARTKYYYKAYVLTTDGAYHFGGVGNFTTGCDHEYTEDVIDEEYGYDDEDYEEHWYSQEIEYTCEYCGDSYTEWTDEEYEAHEWDETTSTCDLCDCVLPKLTIENFAVEDEYTLGDVLEFDGSIEGNGSDILRVRVNVQKPGEDSDEYFASRTVNKEYFNLINVADLPLDKEGEWGIYIWAVDAAGNGYNSADAEDKVGTFVYYFDVVDDCDHQNTKEVETWWQRTRIPGNNEQHTYSVIYKVVCKDCGVTIEEDLERSELEDHDFDSDGECVDCGYILDKDSEEGAVYEVLVSPNPGSISDEYTITAKTSNNVNEVIFYADGYNLGCVNSYVDDGDSRLFELKYTFTEAGRRKILAYPYLNGTADTANGSSEILVINAKGILNAPNITSTNNTGIKCFDSFKVIWEDNNTAVTDKEYVIYLIKDEKLVFYADQIGGNSYIIPGEYFSETGVYVISIYVVAPESAFSRSEAASINVVAEENVPSIWNFDDSTETISFENGRIQLDGQIVSNGGTINKITISVLGPNNGYHYKEQNIDATTFNLINTPVIVAGSGVFLTEGKYTISIWAQNTGSSNAYIVASKVVEVLGSGVKKLDLPIITSAPTAYVGNDYQLVWNSVKNANAYRIVVNDGVFTETVVNTTKATIPGGVLNEVGSHTIKLYALNTENRNYVESDASSLCLSTTVASVSASISSVRMVPTALVKGEVATFTVETSQNVDAIRLLDGTFVCRTWSAGSVSVDQGSIRTWTVSHEINTPGNNRVLYFELRVKGQWTGITASTDYFNVVAATEQLSNFNVTATVNKQSLGTGLVLNWTTPENAVPDYYSVDVRQVSDKAIVFRKDECTTNSLSVPLTNSTYDSYIVTVTAFKSGFGSVYAQTQISTTCQHTRSQVMPENTKFVTKSTGSSTEHAVSVSEKIRCLDCGTVLDGNTYTQNEAHIGFGGIKMAAGGLICACGYVDCGGFASWIGYIQHDKDLKVYTSTQTLYKDIVGTVFGKTASHEADKVTVLSESADGQYYYIKYPASKGAYKYGFIPKYNNDDLLNVAKTIWKPDTKYLMGQEATTNRVLMTNEIDMGVIGADIVFVPPYDINIVEEDHSASTLLFALSQVYRPDNFGANDYTVLHVPFQLDEDDDPVYVQFGIGNKTLGEFEVLPGAEVAYCRVNKNKIVDSGEVWFMYEGEKHTNHAHARAGKVYELQVNCNNFSVSWEHVPYQGYTEDNGTEVIFGLVTGIGGFAKSFVTNISKGVLKSLRATIAEAARDWLIDQFKECYTEDIKKFIKTCALEWLFSDNLTKDEIIAMIGSSDEVKRLTEDYVLYGVPLGIEFDEFCREVSFMKELAESDGAEGLYDISVYGPGISIQAGEYIGYRTCAITYPDSTTSISDLESYEPDVSSMDYAYQVLVNGFKNLPSYLTWWGSLSTPDRLYMFEHIEKLIDFEQHKIDKVVLINIDYPALLFVNDVGAGLLLYMFGYDATGYLGEGNINKTYAGSSIYNCSLFTFVLSESDVTNLLNGSCHLGFRGVSLSGVIKDLKGANTYTYGNLKVNEYKVFDVSHSQGYSILSKFIKYDNFTKIRRASLYEHARNDFSAIIADGFEDANLYSPSFFSFGSTFTKITGGEYTKIGG